MFFLVGSLLPTFGLSRMIKNLTSRICFSQSLRQNSSAFNCYFFFFFTFCYQCSLIKTIVLSGNILHSLLILCRTPLLIQRLISK